MVLNIFRCSEHRKYTVTQELDNCTVILLDNSDHSLEIVIKNSYEFFCTKLRTQRRKPTQITHKYRYVLCHAATLLPFDSRKGIIGNVR